MINELNLTGKVALVTGAKQGIGKEAALRFAACGANVVVVDLSISAEDEVCKEVVAFGAACLAISCDVSDEAAVQTAFSAVQERFGRLDVLVNNAGITLDAMAKKMTAERFRKVLDVNLVGTFLCAQQAMVMMKENGGSIINLSSIAGVMGNVGQSNYAASKAGVIGLTKALALEGAKDYIRVNAIVPGFIDTSMTAGMPENIRAMAIEKIPLKRSGQPVDIANAMLFFGSELSSFITGQIINVNGGRYM